MNYYVGGELIPITRFTRRRIARRIDVVKSSSPPFGVVTKKEWVELENRAIKVWHFERCDDGRGVKPVSGKYDSSNPKHVRSGDVIKIHTG